MNLGGPEDTLLQGHNCPEVVLNGVHIKCRNLQFTADRHNL